jgi:phosphatidylserine/phosphatidylglycerophosphate/cardiolipin synthase-like enzyme
MKLVKHLSWLLLLLLVVSGCETQSIPAGPAGGGNNILDPRPVGADWYEIYFTDPTCPPDTERVDGVDEIIAADLLQAQRSVDIAAFDLDAEPIVNALITLEGEGIPVRVVTDTDNEELPTINRLRRNGISVITDDRSALMHNKFIVIDGTIVWTGSLNYTTNGAYCNNNNAVRIASADLARNYTREMDEMYIDRLFGPRSPDNTPAKQLKINGVVVENYFAAEDEIAPVIVDLIAAAEDSIQFMAFSFTHEDIGEAMIAAAEEGVLVEGVFETTGANTAFSYYPDMRDAGLPNLRVLKDGNPRIMHHKVIIIDGHTVILGSYNFSGSANDSNDENVLIVHDPTFTGFFQEEFDLIWAEAEARADN